MNFEDISSQSFSALFIEEFGPPEEGRAVRRSAPSIAPQSHQPLKKSDSRRKLGMPLLQKASSMRNVLFRRNPSEDATPLLIDSSDDTTTDNEELRDGSHCWTDRVIEDEADLFKGLCDDAAKSQVLSIPPDTDKVADNVTWKRNPGGVTRRRRNGRRGDLLSRSQSSRRLGDRQSSFKNENMGASERSLGRRGPTPSLSSRRLGDSLSSFKDSNMGSSQTSLGTRRAEEISKRGGRPQLVRQISQRRNRPNRRRITENSVAPKDALLRNLEMTLNRRDDEPSSLEQPRLNSSKSSSEIEKTNASGADDAIRRTRSAADCRTRGDRRASNKNKAGRAACRKQC